MNVGFYRNHQDFQYSFSFEGDNYLSIDKIVVDTRIANAELDYRWTDKWSILFSFYNSSYTNNYLQEGFEDSLLVNALEQFNSIDETSYTLSNSINISHAWQIDAGYEFNIKEVDLDLGEHILIDPDRNELATFQNPFLSSSLAKKHFTLDAGIRNSYYSELKKWVYSPRLNAQFLINDYWKIKTDVGIYHQFISQLSNTNFDQIQVDNPLWIINTSDEQLSQKSSKIAAGFVFNQSGWLVDVEAYYNKTTGLTSLSPVYDLLVSIDLFSRGSSVSKGIDFLIKKQWSGINTWLNYSLGHIENYFPDATENPFFSPNDIRHNVNLVTSYTFKNLQFSLNANYHSGLPYTRPVLVLNEEEGVEPPFLYFLDYPEINVERLRNYMRFDLNVNYRPSFNRIPRLKAECSLSVINLLNTQNVVAREYFQDFNEVTNSTNLAYIQKSLLGRTPLLLLRFYF